MRQYQHFRSLSFRIQPYQIERKIGFCNTDVGAPVAAASRDGRVVDLREPIELERGEAQFLSMDGEVDLPVLEGDGGEHRSSLDAAFFGDPQNELVLAHLADFRILAANGR